MNDGWISVLERLPTREECEKYNNTFIVQTNNGEVLPCEYDPLANGYDEPWWCCNSIVIAWQPLPDSFIPKKGAENDERRKIQR